MSMFSRISSGKQLLGSKDTLHGTPPRDKGKPEDEQAFEPVPDYPNDLNAIHGAEKALDPNQQGQYLMNLAVACGCGFGERNIKTTTATAAQRAEAFLRTIGKWED